MIGLAVGATASMAGSYFSSKAKNKAEAEALHREESYRYAAEQKLKENIGEARKTGKAVREDYKNYLNVGQESLERLKKAAFSTEEDPYETYTRKRAEDVLDKKLSAFGGLRSGRGLQSQADLQANLGSQFYNRRMGLLSDLNNMGYSATGATAGSREWEAGNVMASNQGLAGLYTGSGQIAGASSRAKGSNRAGLYEDIGSAVGKYATGYAAYGGLGGAGKLGAGQFYEPGIGVIDRG